MESFFIKQIAKYIRYSLKLKTEEKSTTDNILLKLIISFNDNEYFGKRYVDMY